ncbi:MAG: hypothetical protein H6773_02090 [Pseudomonadales bacterium]|nr:hypothetical protein [Candidatus Woesebacteria bacterium]MCB9800947.1 hypothetical protein [Pseudomonadales bacterium]
MKTLFLLGILSGSLGVRFLRWFAFLQQKEYRFDRLKLFLLSKEGTSEMFRIVPQQSDLSWGGLKRPKVTGRMVICMAIASLLVLSGAVGVLVWSLLFSPVIMVLSLLTFFVSVYLFVPLIVFVSALPTVILANQVTMRTAKKAGQLLEKYQPTIIGITGSYGKSSTKLLLAHVLKSKSVYATPKSFNTLFSISQSVLSGYQGEEMAIIEYAAYMPGEIAKITRFIRPNAAVITGFAPQHLGLFGSEENIISAKAELVAALPEKAPVFVNAQSPGAARIARQGAGSNQAEIISVDWKDIFSEATLTKEGFLQITFKGKKMSTQFIGLHYLEVIALAWRVASEHVPEKELLARLADFVPPASFISSSQHSSGARIIDDGGTSNPQGFSVFLSLLEEISENKKITVITPGIVDLGSQSAKIHTALMERMSSFVSTICYVGETEKDLVESLGGKKVLTDREQITQHLASLDKTAIVGIEGRMPSWVIEALGT